jgi:uncharacterized protein (TIGR00369 family)
MSTFGTTKRRPLQALNEDFEAKVRRSFEFNGFKNLGGTLTEVKLGAVEARLPYSDLVRQQHGWFHGGIVAMAADVVAGYAGYTILAADEECVSAEFKVNFMQPAKGETLIARGGIIKVGRTLIISEATVSVLRGSEEIECAIMLQTLARVNHVKSGAN